MKAWAVDLAQRCHPPKPERKRHRVLGNVVEDLSRLLAPLL
jgi:cardiolipin synthase